MSDESDASVEVRAAPESPHNAALYEAGKQLLAASADVGREFCKFMVGTSTAAIPVYLGLVGLATGRAYHPTVLEGALLLLGPAVFVVAAAVFAWGYFPVHKEVSLDLPADIELVLEATLNRRYRAAKYGFSLFALAAMLSVAGAVYALAIDVPHMATGTSAK